MSNPTVREIVGQYLKRNGFDGLFHNECACELAELMPCYSEWADVDGCQAGYRIPCPPDCGDHDWHMVAEKKEDDNAVHV